MYSVTELSKMFNTTRATIYNKFKDVSIQHYVKDTKTGRKLEKEGLSEFQILMAESKRYSKNTSKNTVKNSSLNTDYIESLKEQIIELKEDKKNLLEQIKTKDSQLENKNNTIKSQIDLIKNGQDKILLLSEHKKNNPWWKFWSN